MTETLKATIGNDEWWAANEDKVKAILPAKFTDLRDLKGLHLGFGLKLLGIDWRSDEEFGGVMILFEKIGVLQRLGTQVRANPDRVFPAPDQIEALLEKDD